MQVAVASADGVSISQHFGRSQCFIIFDVDGEKIGDPTVRPNTFTAHARGECDGEHGHHDQPHSHSSIVAALQDCTAVLCYGMGWRAAEDLTHNGIRPFVIDGMVSPKEAVEQFVAKSLKSASGFCRCHAQPSRRLDMTGSPTHFDKAAGDWDNEPRRIALMKAIGEAILREVDVTDEMDVLDYGCGTGLIGLFLLPHVHSVTGADNSAGMLEVLRSKIAAGGLDHMQAICLDLEHDPLPRSRYHMIVAGMTLHHIADTESVLRAFHALLVSGGTLCLADLDTEPGTFHPADMADVVFHHGFNRQSLKQQLAGIGFSQMTDTTAMMFHKPVEGQDDQEFSVFLITGRTST